MCPAVSQSEGTGRARIDKVVVCQGLSLLMLEAKRAGQDTLADAWSDLVVKLGEGFSRLFYGRIPFLPVVAAAGEQLQFGWLLPTGQVSIC